MRGSERRDRAMAQRHHEEFKAWLGGHGVDMSKLRLVPASSGLSWGAVAATRLPRGTTVASIPVSIALTEDAVLRSDVAADAKRLGLDASVRTLTYIFMLLQRADRQSYFGPYLRAIPVRHTDPMSWSAAELALLHGSNLLPQHHRRKSELRAEFVGAVRPLCDAFPSRYSSDVLSWRQFLWAHSSFVSRNLPLEPDAHGQLRLTTDSGRAEHRQQCLLPLIDMLNHKYAAPIIWQSEGGDGRTTPTVGLAVGEDVESGTEIFNNYGPKSNQELLRLYGFVLEENPQDTFELEVAGLAAEDEQELQAKKQLFANYALPRQHFLRRASDMSARSRWIDRDVPVRKLGTRKRKRKAVFDAVSVVPASLLSVLRLAMLNQPELLMVYETSNCSQRADIKQRNVVENLLNGPISGRSEMAALRTLLNLLREKLTKLSSDKHPNTTNHTNVDYRSDAQLAWTPATSGGGASHCDTEALLDDGSDDDELEKGTVRPFIEAAVGVYIRGQRELLQLGITECENRLWAVAAATTRLHSWYEWQLWYRSIDSCTGPKSSIQSGASRIHGRHRLQVSESTHLDATSTAKACDHASQTTVTAYDSYRLSVVDTALHVTMDDRAVRATSNLNAGDALLSVPRANLITVQSALQAGTWGEALATIDGIDEDTILMLYLIHERSKHQQQSTGTGAGINGSRWSPFFVQHDLCMRTGAAAAYPPCSWGAAALPLQTALARTEVGESATQAQLALADLHSALFPALSDAFPQFFSSETYSLEALRWAAGVLAIYSVQLQASAPSVAPSNHDAENGNSILCGITAVVPLVEASPRHRTDATCFHEYDATTDSYVLKTLRPVHCGDEVAICRGRGGDAASLLGDSGTAYAARASSCPGSWMREGHAVRLQVAQTQAERHDSATMSTAVTIKAYVTETGGELLFWPPGATPDLLELQKAARDHSDRLQKQAVAVSEAAVVQAGRTGQGEVMLRGREYVLTQLAVARAVYKVIDKKLSAQ